MALVDHPVSNSRPLSGWNNAAKVHRLTRREVKRGIWVAVQCDLRAEDENIGNARGEPYHLRIESGPIEYEAFLKLLDWQR